MSDTLHLLARVGGRAVAFPADQIDSVVDLGAITPVPLAPPGVIGLAALRSRVVTVIDPNAVLGLAGSAATARRAVVTHNDGHAYAVLVEVLEDVAEYRRVPLPAGLMLDAGWQEAGSALLDRPGEPVLVVDLAQLIPAATDLAA